MALWGGRTGFIYILLQEPHRVNLALESQPLATRGARSGVLRYTLRQ